MTTANGHKPTKPATPTADVATPGDEGSPDKLPPGDPIAIPENAVPIDFPVLALEGMETADRRFIEPGALTHRAVPLTIYAQTRTPDGGQGHDNADIVGALTELTSRPGSEVTSKSTGQPFPDDVTVWSGRGWMYTDVPAYRMVKDGALSGNSVDLSAVDATVVYADDTDEQGQMRMSSGVIGATTLVGLPAFPDAYVVLDGQQVAPTPASLAASVTPMWRSADLGDVCSPCLAGVLVASINSKIANFPVAPDDTKWDAAAATQHIESYAGTDQSALASCFLYQDDTADPKTVGAYGFPLVDVIDGKLTLVPAAVSAAAGRLDGSDLPAADKAKAKTVLAAAYKHMGKTAPWEKDLQAAGNPAYETSGMVALVPDDPASFVVDGGDPADEMHCTLAYLGNDLDQWSPQQIDAVHDAVTSALNPGPTGQSTVDDADDPTSVQASSAPEPKIPRPRPSAVQARVMGHATWNADGGPTGDMQPATVYDLGNGTGVHALRDSVVSNLHQKLGEVGKELPQQHAPFKPHITAGYNVPQSKLERMGPVSFSKVRVAAAGTHTDYPLDGSAPSVTAAAYPTLSAAAFRDPSLTKATPLTFTERDGITTVHGHIAKWGTCHIGFSGQCVTPPSSASHYAYFHTGQVLTDGGPVDTGHITFATGHAGDRLSAGPAIKHYDNTGTVGADVVCGEDTHGIWVAGVVREHLTPAQLREFQAAPPSGDWRSIGGSLELVAVLSVNTPGFPVPRARVASGAQLALVAGGQLAQLPVTKRGLIDMAALAAEVEKRIEERAQLARDMDVLAGKFTAYLEREYGDLEARYELLAGEPLVNTTAAELEALHERLAELAGYGVSFEQLVGAPSDADVEFAQNWVQKAGGLPKYIDRIRKHLEEKGTETSRAIATAVNAAKKMCSTGDLNFPGLQKVNAGSKAEACAAVADWNAKRAGSKAGK